MSQKEVVEKKIKREHKRFIKGNGGRNCSWRVMHKRFQLQKYFISFSRTIWDWIWRKIWEDWILKMISAEKRKPQIGKPHYSAKEKTWKSSQNKGKERDKEMEHKKILSKKKKNAWVHWKGCYPDIRTVYLEKMEDKTLASVDFFSWKIEKICGKVS